MIEAAALSGFPMAVACCLQRRWDQTHPEQYFNGSGSVDKATCRKRALAMYVKIEQETKYHWAQFELASLYFYGYGTDQDYTTAVEWFTKASAQGNSVAMSNLGCCYAAGHGCDQDYTTAFKWFTKASAQGDTCAMNNLGLCWMNGWGCDQNQTTAFEWYKKSAQLGDKDAQDKLNSRMFSPNPAALGANGNEQSHTSKRRQPDSSTSTSDSDDDLL